VHHWPTIVSDDARAVVMGLLASGRVTPLQPTRLGVVSPAINRDVNGQWRRNMLAETRTLEPFEFVKGSVIAAFEHGLVQRQFGPMHPHRPTLV
jgi:hypothetical protein